MNEGRESYEKGRMAMDGGRLEEAILFFQKSTVLTPHFKTFELLGECFLKLKRANESIGPLAAAVALNRGTRAAALLAEAFLTIGDAANARDFAEVALTRDPSNKKAKEILIKTAVNKPHERTG